MVPFELGCSSEGTWEDVAWAVQEAWVQRPALQEAELGLKYTAKV